jgi:hypothetical protein
LQARWWSPRGPVISIETKEKMKDRTRRSPDLADGAVVLAQVANARAGLNPNAVAHNEPLQDSPWKRFLKTRNQTPEYVAPIV